ncbi:MAG: hypothetical protein ACPG7F_19925, partial [Aggregatilineales bacterium]
IAYVYSRDNIIFNVFINLLRSMWMNSPRRFFRTEEEAIAWLLSKQEKHREENNQDIESIKAQ